MKLKGTIILVISILLIIITLGLSLYFCKKIWKSTSNFSKEEEVDVWLVKNFYKQFEYYKEIKKYTNQKSKDNIINIPVYYINMDKNPERRECLEEQLKEFNAQSTRIVGVNGAILDNINHGVLNKHAFVNTYSDLSKSEVGCILSHIIAIETAKKDNTDMALILEDDANITLAPYWDNNLRNIIANAPNDWEIISLFTMGGIIGGKKQFIKHDKLKPVYSSVAYVINRKGIDKLLKQTITSDGTIILDSPYTTGESDRYIYNLLNSYYLNKPLIIPVNSVNDSTIHPEHTSDHIKRSNIILSIYSKFNLFYYPKKQIKFAKALHDMINFLDFLNIPYRLSSGTLLGAFRQGEFISYDLDIDIEVLIEDYNPIIEKGNNNVPELNLYGIFKKSEN